MDRIIKFRAKNKQGHWIHWNIKDGIQPTDMMEDGDLDWRTLGQFTGLMDLNEKEIYEGDIVKWGGDLTPVEFQNGGFVLTDFGRGENGKKVHTVYVNLDELEIIGNIYENKDLIK